MNKRKELYGAKGFTFSQQEVIEALADNRPLTLDLAIQSGCRNRCIYCGWHGAARKNLLTLEEILDLITQASNLGVKSIEFLGMGEPTTRKDILVILQQVKESGMTPVLFTCGDVVGEDEWSLKIHRESGFQFAEKLFALDVTVMLSYQRQYEDDIAGFDGFSAARNLALSRLLEIGFNQVSPTRLGLASVILRENVGELPVIYRCALKRNIYPLFCPLMPVGKSKSRESRFTMGISPQELVDLTARLHKVADECGYHIGKVSDFPGSHQCFVSSNGFYIDPKGDVYICEGMLDYSLGNVRQESLADLWQRVQIKKRCILGENLCQGLCHVKRCSSIIPVDFETRVLDRLCQEALL